MSATKVQHVSVLPGDHDDPSPGSSGYWMALLGVFTVFCMFALTYLYYEFEQLYRYGPKAPQGQSQLDELHAAQEAELSQAVRGDLVHLADGRTIDAGKAVRETPADGEGEVVRIVDVRGNVVREGEGPLELPADLVSRVEPGKGKLLRVPLERGRELFLEAYRTGQQ